MLKRNLPSKEKKPGRIATGLRPAIVIFLLVAMTGATFWSAGHHQFINLDDDLYVTENEQVKKGLTASGTGWAFSTFHSANYHPLTWLSHMLDVELFGLNPGAHHLVNVAHHALNAVLLFLVLRLMTGALWKSGMVAALFAIHPLHIESVAWIAERKDVLSTLFWFLTMAAYFRYTKRPGVGRYSLVVVAFLGGLLSKPMVITLPFVLLLLDYWPLRRFPEVIYSEHNIKGLRWLKRAIPLVVEKIPLFFLSAVASAVTYHVQKIGGAFAHDVHYPISIRIGNALVSCTGYIGKMLLPVRLAVFYPHPGGSLPLWKVAGSALLLASLTAIALYFSRRRPCLIVGWFWYLGTLVPVAGLVQVGWQAMADRYTYVPLTGLFIAVVWTAADLTERWKFQKEVLASVSLAVLLALGISAGTQVSYWRDSITLFGHALESTTGNYLAHYNLGVALQRGGRTNEAADHYRLALTIKPDSAKAHYNLGLISAKQGRLDEAKRRFSEALVHMPTFAEARYNLGLACLLEGRVEEAAVHFEESLRLRPDFLKARESLRLLRPDGGRDK